ncbi:unnamed protein product [Phyllotreta striolata]|uniref:O-acyltransferase WSD1 C-terminal domain-containing protein n=1 Tax=Phyllotreta striolata TaxID=444603 RepID=A0A9N9TSI8_PHYSR|nr:unnamed protein product [Phyllotreta striolata]
MLGIGLMDIVYGVISSFMFPGFVTLVSFLVAFKFSVNLLLKFLYLRRLVHICNSDTYYTGGRSSHNLIKFVFFLKDKPGDHDLVKNIKDVVQQRVLNHPDKFAKLSSSYHSFLGYPYLLKEDVTPEDVVSVVDMEEKEYKSVQEVLYAYSDKPMPRNDTLPWQILVLKASVEWRKDHDMEPHRTPVFMRFQHFVADPLSTTNFIYQSLGENNATVDQILKITSKKRPGVGLSPWNLLRNFYVLQLVPGYLLVGLVLRLLTNGGGPYPCKSGKHNVGYKALDQSDRSFKYMKLVREKLGETYLTVILTAVAGSFHSYFQKLNKKMPHSINVTIGAVEEMKPMTTNGVPQLFNQFILMEVKLPIKARSGSLLKKLHTIKKDSNKLVENSNFRIKNFIFDNLLQLVPNPFKRFLFPVTDTWASVTSMPDIQKAVLFNGYEVEESFFFTAVKDQMVTGFGSYNYEKRIQLSFMSDESSMQTKEDCDVMVEEFFKSIEQLKDEVVKKK